MQVLSAERRELIEVFTGLRPVQFRRLVQAVKYRGGRTLDPVQARAPLGPVAGGQGSAGRGLLPDQPHDAPARAAVRRLNGGCPPDHRPAQPVPGPCPHPPPPTADEVVIVDGTLVPTHDRSVAAPSKNCRHSANLQILIDAHTRLVLAVGKPVPGNRNDCQAIAESGIDAACGDAVVLADGAYRDTGTLIPHRRRPGQDLDDWQKDDNRSHRRVRARVEHAVSRMKNWKILRACRRKSLAVYWAASGIARMHNLALAG